MKDRLKTAIFSRRIRSNPKTSLGFTLIEMLVVVTIISLLLAIMQPALASVRENTRLLQCSTNLRAIGQSLTLYASDYSDTLPISYDYKGTTLTNNIQLPKEPIDGIVHWSAVLINGHFLSENAFQCSSMSFGGLPAANPSEDARESGQISLTPGVVDEQVGRCAYTLNEALFPRNRFVEGFEDAITPSKFIRLSQINNLTNVIMATEWTDSWSAVHVSGMSNICQSYLPVNGFAGVGPMQNDRYDMNAIGNLHPCFGDYRVLSVSDLTAGSQVINGSGTRLDLVGKNHGCANTPGEAKKTNFVYADGHVETKLIYDTLNPFEWGEKLYWAYDRIMQ